MLLFVEHQTDLPLPTTIPHSLLQSKDPLRQTEPIQLLQPKMQLETPMEPLLTRSRLELSQQEEQLLLVLEQPSLLPEMQVQR